jgi:hypothetical protein
MSSQKQRSKRYNYSAFVRVIANQSDIGIIYNCKNLSSTGAFLECSSNVKKGSRIVIEVMDPSTKDFIEIESIVQWKMKNRNSISGVGIEFVNVSAEKKEKLSNLINYIDRVLNDNKDAV